MINNFYVVAIRWIKKTIINNNGNNDKTILCCYHQMDKEKQ